MSLLPTSKGEDKGDSPAVALTKLYARNLSVSQIPIPCYATDFKKLLKKHSFDEIKRVILWLQQQPEHTKLKPSSWFVYRFDWLRFSSKNDLSDYPVGDVSAISRKIGFEGGNFIPSTYIQHALDSYGVFLEWMRTQPDGKPIYDFLPPPNDFVVRWFGVYVPNYSNQYRKFTTGHEAFRQYLYKVALKSSSRPVADRLLKAYEEYRQKNDVL
jgi:hypothetical protein